MRLKVPPGSWLTGILSAFGIVYRQGYEPELGEQVVPVYQINNPNVVNNVTQFGDQWTSTGQAYGGRQVVNAGGVGNVSQIQLWNPAGSGVNVYLDRCMLQPATAANGATVLMSAVDLAGAAGQMGSKDQDSGARKARISGGSVAAVNGAYQVEGTGQSGPVIVFDPPILLRPGRGVNTANNGANDTFTATFQWREVPGA